MTAQALAPRPTVWARPTSRAVDLTEHRPRRAAGARARPPGRAPEAPSGSPFERSPPLGFTGRAPPSATSPSARSRGLFARRAQSRARRTPAAPGPRRCPGTRRRRCRRGRRPLPRRRRRAASVDGGVMSVSSMPESGVASPRTLPGRCERSRADASVTAVPPAPIVARRSTIAAAPSLGEHSMQRCNGSQTSRDASTSVGRHLLAEHRVRVVHAVPPVLHDDLARDRPSSDSCSRSSAARAARSTRASPRARPPRATARRSDERMMPFGIFSTPNTSDAVVLPGADRARRELERGAAARATRPRCRRSGMPVRAIAPSTL